MVQLDCVPLGFALPGTLEEEAKSMDMGSSPGDTRQNQQAHDGQGQSDSASRTSGEGAASALARFKSQREQQANHRPPEAPQAGSS